MKWDSGSSLGPVYGEDYFRKFTDCELKDEKTFRK